jgi:hypothetical protein
LSIGTKTGDSLDTPLIELDRHFDFFLPLTVMEKAQHQFENPSCATCFDTAPVK